MATQHHLLIAGTGRAGTSVLVQYLNRLGLETHHSRPDGSVDWHDNAQAGLEDLAICTEGRPLPYVLKSPWTYQIIDQLVSDRNIRLDAVLIPIRDLVEAAASRSIVQLQAMHEQAGWMTEVATPWEHWGAAPGGAIFSVNPIDQSRLLAVGFHRLIERLVYSDIPIVFLSFPRLTIDADYLFHKIRVALPIEIPITKAREAHAAVFDYAKVRAGGELASGVIPSRERRETADSTTTALDNIALKRELKRLRREIDDFRRREAERSAMPARRAGSHLRRVGRRLAPWFLKY